MAEQFQVPVKVYSRNYRELPPASGVITQIRWNAKDKPKNAIKTFGLFIALTFGCVFVPIAHYFLVPSFFILSFILALEKLREKERSLGGVGQCPKCGKEFLIVKSAWAERLTDTCNHCHEDVEIFIQPQ